MAASKKRRVVEHKDVNGSDSENSEYESMDDEEIADTEVQVDFEARVPDDSDFHGIKRLLKQLFLKSHINLADVADLLIKQNYICSVIKQSEPDDMDEDDSEDGVDENYGVSSVIDITGKKDIECIRQICAYLLEKCRTATSAEDFQKFEALLNDPEKHIGLIISERFMNIPPQISLPLFESLSEDMKKAKEEKKIVEFSYYILISKILEDSSDNNQDLIYTNAEEELFVEDSLMKYDFSVAGEQDNAVGGEWDDGELNPKRRIMVFPSNKWNTLLEKLRSEFGPRS